MNSTSEQELIFQCTDSDPRVRAKAIREMCMRSRNALTFASYLTIRDLCSNSSMNVRLSALRVLEKLAQQYPEHMVKNQRGYEVRVHDDAFSVMCHAINDLETPVRTEAATLLRNFENVSAPFLHQTLDKKLLAPMKLQKDGTSSSLTGGWSTGKKFGEAAPDMPDDDDESLALLPTNTCGAFITALEDEFMAVRLPAVCSLCSLAESRPEFAFAAVDHVSDMFNDEMHEIRLASIRALMPLLRYVKLNEAQLSSILSVSNDATLDTRLALHELLTQADFADSSCIWEILKQLMISMQRFPQDRDSIYKCLSLIGQRHSFLIHALVPELFKLHPLFDPQEPDLNDMYYLAHLIMAMNAAAVQKPIRPLVPKFAIKHYQYIRHAMPTLVPMIEDFEDKSLGKQRLRDNSTNDLPTKQFECKVISPNTPMPKQEGMNEAQFSFIYRQLLDAYSSTTHSDGAMFLKMVLKDLNTSEKSVKESTMAPFRLLRMLCELLINYDFCLQRRYTGEVSVLNVIKECLQIITQIRHLFNNLHQCLLQFLAECEFHLKLEHLFLTLDTENNDLTDMMVMEQINTEITTSKRQFEKLAVGCSEPTQRLFTWVSEFINTYVERVQKLQSGSKKPEKDKKDVMASLSLLSSETHRVTQKLGECRLTMPPELPNLGKSGISIRATKILELTDSQGRPINCGGTGPDSIHRFVAGLPTALKLHANLFNMDEHRLPDFRVEIIYPDNSRDYQAPEPGQLVKLTPRNYCIEMTLIISASHWAEPSDVRIRCGLLISDEDEKEETKHEEDVEMSEEDDCTTETGKKHPKFIPFLDMDRLSHPNGIQLRVHPMLRC